MEKQTIHIDEENTHIIWGLIAVVAIGGATYVLINAFMAGSWHIGGARQILSLALFSLGFYGVIRITTPLYHFVLSGDGSSTLAVEIWQEGDEPVNTYQINLNNIRELRIAPHSPRSSDDALFDFTTNYYLLYKTKQDQEFKRLIDLEGKSFTLKVDDIRQIMELILSLNPDIYVPGENSIFVDLRR